MVSFRLPPPAKSEQQEQKADEDEDKLFPTECGKNMKTAPFSALKKFYEDIGGLDADDCFKLSEKEFLLFVNSTGRVGQGIYFVNTASNEMKMDEDYGYGLVELIEDFSDKQGIRHLFIVSVNMIRGRYSESFDVVTVVPDGKGKPYIIQNLVDTLASDSGGCEDLGENDKKADRVLSRKIDKEQEDIAIVFDIKEQDCKTKEMRTYKRTFKLTDKKFTEEKQN